MKIWKYKQREKVQEWCSFTAESMQVCVILLQFYCSFWSVLCRNVGGIGGRSTLIYPTAHGIPANIFRSKLLLILHWLTNRIA